MVGFRKTSRTLASAAVAAALLLPAAPALAAPGPPFEGAPGALVKALHDLGALLLGWWPDRDRAVTKDTMGMDPNGSPTNQDGAGMDPNGSLTSKEGAGMDPDGFRGVATVSCGDDTAGMDPDGAPCTP